jgi:hypothetical protein
VKKINHFSPKSFSEATSSKFPSSLTTVVKAIVVKKATTDKMPEQAAGPMVGQINAQQQP